MTTITLFCVRATRLFRSYDGDMVVSMTERYFLSEADAITFGTAYSKGSKGCTYSVTSFDVE